MPNGVGVFQLPIPIINGADEPTGLYAIPMLVVEGSGYALGSVFELPQLEVTGTGAAPLSTGLFHVPVPVVTSVGYAGILGTGRVTLPVPVMTGGYGYRGSGTFVLPVFEVSTITPLHAVGEFVLPSFGYSGYGRGIPIQKIYRGIVANLLNEATTTYSGYPFNSIAYFDGHYLGANETGLYVLEGDKDNGIHILSRLKSGSTDFGDNFLKRVLNIWLTHRTDGHLKLTVCTDEENPDSEADFSEDSTQIVNTKIHEERLKAGRGLKGRFYTFELMNISGADFDIDSLSILIEAIRRRIR
jgi:hypothetical protein